MATDDPRSTHTIVADRLNRLPLPIAEVWERVRANDAAGFQLALVAEHVLRFAVAVGLAQCAADPRWPEIRAAVLPLLEQPSVGHRIAVLAQLGSIRPGAGGWPLKNRDPELLALVDEAKRAPRVGALVNLVAAYRNEVGHGRKGITPSAAEVTRFQMVLDALAERSMCLLGAHLLFVSKTACGREQTFHAWSLRGTKPLAYDQDRAQPIPPGARIEPLHVYLKEGTGLLDLWPWIVAETDDGDEPTRVFVVDRVNGAELNWIRARDGDVPRDQNAAETKKYLHGVFGAGAAVEDSESRAQPPTAPARPAARPAPRPARPAAFPSDPVTTGEPRQLDAAMSLDPVSAPAVLQAPAARTPIPSRPLLAVVAGASILLGGAVLFWSLSRPAPPSVDALRRSPPPGWVFVDGQIPMLAQQHEATVGEHKRCLDARDCSRPRENPDIAGLRGLCTLDRGRDDLPVNCMWPDEASDLCEHLGRVAASRDGRIPTLDQWTRATGWSPSAQRGAECTANLCDAGEPTRCARGVTKLQCDDQQTGPTSDAITRDRTSNGLVNVFGNLAEMVDVDGRIVAAGRSFRSGQEGGLPAPVARDDEELESGVQFGVRCVVPLD